jgi:large subunit ribosomal protein L10
VPTERKQAAVAELKDLVSNASMVIGAEYRGLSVKEMTALRRALREAGVEARVVKNRLFQLAAEQAGVADAGQVVEGPTLIIFAQGDIVAPAKAVADYTRTARNAFAAKKVFMDGQVSPGSLVAELASLPSREELIGKLAGAFISPVQNLASLLNDSIQGFARLVDARATQLEGEGGSAG